MASYCPHCGGRQDDGSFQPLDADELDQELCRNCGRPFDRPWADLPKAGPDMEDETWEP